MFSFHDAISPMNSDPSLHVVSGMPLDLQPGNGDQLIYFAAGCFWGVEKIFWELPGVVVTAVGYMGGNTPHPTYEQVCTGDTGHCETVRVVYDPRVVSDGKIISTFFEIHDPTQRNQQGNDIGTQYRSAIWTTTPHQHEVAVQAREQFQCALIRAGFAPITTEIMSVSQDRQFWQAEDYHQGYLWKNPQGYQCHVRTGLQCPVIR